MNSTIRTNSHPHIIVGWKVLSLSQNIASVRYRALLPILALEDRGVESRLFSDGNSKNLNGLDVLVIVKGISSGDISLVHEAAKRDIPIMFDLCDNIFVDGYDNKRKAVSIFLSIANYATAIVAPTQFLADEISRYIGGCTPVYVVFDGIDTGPLIAAGRRRLIAAQPNLLQRLIQWAYKTHQKRKELRTKSFTRSMRSMVGYCQNFLSSRYWGEKIHPHYDTLRSRWHGRPMNTQTILPEEISTPIGNAIPADTVPESRGAIPDDGRVRRILWFGNHGRGNIIRFGMLDLLEIREVLEGIATEISVELIVISNDIEKYRKHILPLAIPSRYIEWTVDIMAPHLYAADVVVIPNTLDPFSISKSANRSVLALLHGTPVVATRTPALMPLSECCELDDFQSGLRRYLTDPEHASRHIEHGQKLISELYGQPVIGMAWLNTLEMVINTPHYSQRKENNEFIVVLNLTQDLDLAAPILQAAQQRGLTVEAWCSLDLVIKSPRGRTILDSIGVRWRTFPNKPNKVQINKLLHKTKMLLTVSETNLGPHHFTNLLTRVAKRKWHCYRHHATWF
jgi:glycosyltransferase involved in cell wall biosynthesis